MIRILWRLLLRVPVYIYLGICFFAKLLPYPMLMLYRRIKKQLKPTAAGLFFEDWNERFAWFNGLLPFCMFVICAIYSIVSFCIAIGTESGLTAFLETVLFNTPVGSFVGFFIGGLNFTPATVLSIAFSGAICSACLGEDVPEGFKGYLSYTLRAVVFFIATSLLAAQLAGLFQIIGDWMYQVLLSLINTETHDFFPTLGKVLVLLVLGYPALQMLLLALKEYSETIIYGMLFLLTAMVLALIVQYVIDWPLAVENAISGGYAFLGLFGIVLFRPTLDGLLDKWFYKQAPFLKAAVDKLGEE